MAEDDPTINLDDVPTPDGADRLSAILTAIAKGAHRDRISIADLLHALEHRAIGALMFIFAVPNAIPVPPGVSAVLGAPLIFLSFQLMIGRRPWLPRIITELVANETYRLVIQHFRNTGDTTVVDVTIGPVAETPPEEEFVAPAATASETEQEAPPPPATEPAPTGSDGSQSDP